jgi:prolyl oligopeptidase
MIRAVLSYPPTTMGPEADDYHGERIADPYRWLEDTGAPETAAWIAAQNELTESWLGQSADRSALTKLLTMMADYPRYGVPFERGGRWFQFRNPGLADQPVLHVMAAPDDVGHPLLDPNRLSADGTVAVSGAEVSDDGSLLAYSTSSGGSDWQTWRVRDVGTGADAPDIVEWSKFSGAAWRKDGTGFYYGAPDRPAEGTEYLAADGLHRIFFHRLGTPQSQDELVFATADHPDWIPFARVSHDGRFLVISVTAGTDLRTQLHVLDLTEPAATMTALVGDFESTADVVTTMGTTFYLVTDYQAERKRLVAVDLARPDRQHWREIVAETVDTLLEGHYFGGMFVLHYLRDAHSVLRVHDASGSPAGEIALPGLASVGDPCGGEQGLAGRPESDLMHVGVMSFTESGSLWSHRLSDGVSTEIRPSTARIDPAAFRTEQVFVRSADGTAIPMFLTVRAGTEPTGEVPTLLYGYGGFDIPLTPSFSVLHAAWLRGGGLLAVANLRGGGEYGRAWHEAGMLASKQNTFDDFCACAKWLATEGWSGERYPATMLVTGDHDDRVVPGHSFKFAAALQAAQGSEEPVLIRVETSAGHGAGKPTSKIIAESADILAFLRLALDMTGPVSEGDEQKATYGG